MAKLKVRYTIIVDQTIDWPDDEMDNLNYDNLEVNFDPRDSYSTEFQIQDILMLRVDGVKTDLEL